MKDNILKNIIFEKFSSLIENEDFKKEFLRIILDEITPYYSEQHRYYHNLQHIVDVCENISSNIKYDKLSFENKVSLLLSALFHDVIYNPKSNDNELLSCQVCEQILKYGIFEEHIKKVKELILSTKNHIPTCEISKILIEADLSIFNKSLLDLISYERKIFKEFQYVEFLNYKKGRKEVLSKFINENNNVKYLIEYIDSYQPKIALYAGSFSPLTIGHYNIIKKAERIFDKVIVLYGFNPEKNNDKKWDNVPQTLNFHEVVKHNGLLTDYISSLNYPVTLIRGLRNSTDFQYEINQYRFLQEMSKNIDVVNIICDKEFEHVSSSSVRQISKFDNELAKKYILI